MIDAETGWYFTHASIKGVVLVEDAVLLCRNPRDKWELPGGWPSKEDTTLAEVVRREVHEESGLDVAVGLVGRTPERPGPPGHGVTLTPPPVTG